MTSLFDQPSPTNRPASPAVRGTDPSTSYAAAAKALKASQKACGRVLVVMADCVPRIDEQIADECRAQFGIGSPDLYRHARKALRDAGCVEEVGRDKTQNAADSLQWRITAKGRAEALALTQRMNQTTPAGGGLA